MSELVSNGNFGLPDISGVTFKYSTPTGWTKTGTAYLTDTGYALTFNGSNQYVYLPLTTSYDFATVGTIECRFRTTANNSGYQSLMVKQPAYGMFLVNNILSVYDWSTGITTSGVYSGSVNDGYWHQAVFVFQSGVVNGSKLFLDGILVNTFTYNISAQTFQLRIGASGTGQYFNGTIYEARVWNVALSDATVALQNNKAINPATQPNLVGYWAFTEGSGTTAANSVASQPSFTVSTLLWTKLGTIGMADLYEGGYALTFNGTSQYAIVPLATDYSTITSGTIECRFRTTAVNSGVQSLFMKTRAYGIFLNNNILSVYTWGGTPGWIAGVYSGSVNDGNWHQVVFTFQSGVASGSKLFLDGILVTSAFTYTIADQVGKLSIGASHDGTTVQQYFNGSIYEVRVWNAVISDANVALYYNKPIDPDTQGNLTGYWSLREGSGTTAANITTTLPSFTLVNAPVWTQLGAGNAVDLFEGGYGLAFNGSTQYGALASAASYAYTSGTIECRFRTTADTSVSNQKMMIKNSAYGLDISSNQVVGYAFGGGVGYSGTIVNDGNWHHVAFSFTGTSVSPNNKGYLYLDGVLKVTFDCTISGSQANALQIGASSFNGSLDEVRIWSTVLSDATILQNYNRPIDPTSSGLTGYWSLNENVGAIAYNSIPGGPNFTLTGSPVWVKVAKTPSLFHHKNLPSTFKQFACITEINASLIQTVTFPKAGNYTLSFWTTYNIIYYNASTRLSVSVGTLSVTSIAYTSNRWVQYSIPFSVTSSQLTQNLEFKETTVTGTQFWITGVSIVATPTAVVVPVAVPVVVNFAAASKSRYNFFNSAKYTDLGNLLGKKYTLQYETYTKNKQTLLFPTLQEVRPTGLSYSGQVSNGETYTFGPSQDFRMVACGQGAGNTLAYSSNGIQWAGLGKTVFTSSGNAIAWNGSAWLGVGAGGNALAYSLDGIVWTGLGTGTFTWGTSITWNGTLWVLTGAGAGNTLAYSYCGLAFGGLGTTLFETAGYSSAYSGSLWVAGGAGTGNTLAYSADGVQWRGLGKTVFTTACYNVCWNGTVWVGAGIGGNTLAYSYDGLSWTGLGSVLFTTAGNRVEWNGSVFVAGGEGGGNTMAYSQDGIIWTPMGATTFTTRCQSIQWNGSVFLAGGVGGTNTMAYSADGINWTGIGAEMFSTTTLGLSTNNIRPHRIKISPNMSVAVGVGAGNTIAYSIDGINWTGLGTSIFSEGINVTWSGSVWMATGLGGNTLAYSTDGIQWTGLGKTIFDTICWMAKWNGTIWVAVGEGSVNTMAYSTDGIIWKGIGKPIFDYNGASIAWNGSIWVAVGSGSGNSIAYSSDGISWKGLGVSTFYDGYAVAWNGTMFIAVTSDGGNTLAYSYNGIDWTGLGKSVFSLNGYGVTWNGTLWIAVGSGGNTIAYSSDGIQWTGLGFTVFSDYGVGVSWNGILWIASGGDGNPGNTLAYSYDGINWTGSGNTIFTYYGNGVESKTSTSASVYIQHPTLAVGTGGGNTIVYSAEGLYWKGIGKRIFDVAGTGVTWNGSIWVATGNGTKNSLGFSTDGLTWTGLGKSVFASSATEVAWSGTAWVAGGSGGNLLAYSKDGINWTGLGSTFMTSVNTVAWNGQYWLAGGYDTPYNDCIDPQLYLHYTMDVRTTRGIYMKNTRFDFGNTYSSAVLSGKSEAVGTPTINTSNYAVGSGSLAFDVSGQYVAINAGLSSDLSGLTFAFWMRGNNSVGNYTVFDFAGGLGGNNKITWGLQNNTIFTNVVSDSTVGSISFTPLATVGRFSGNTSNNDMAMSNDGTMIVFGGYDTYSNARNFYYRRGMDALDVSINFTGKTTGTSISCLAITGDGKRLVYAYDTTVAYLTWSDASQNFINPVIISSSVPNAFGMDMTEDGSTIVLACGGWEMAGRVPLWSSWTGSSYTAFSSLNTGIPVSNSVSTPYYYWTACAITADGSRVAYGSQDQNTVFYLMKKEDAYQNTIQSFTIGGGGAWRLRFSKDGNVLFIGTNGGGVYYSFWNGTSYGNATQIIPSSVNYGSSIIYISVSNLVVDYNNNVYFGAVRSLFSKDIKKTTFTLSNLYTKSNLSAIQSAYPNLNDNTWRHFAWTIDPVSKTYSHYINGSLMATDMSTGYVFPQTGFNRTLNRLGVANDLSLSYFLGGVDDFRVYKRVLRPLEIQSLMSTHHYTMDAASVNGTYFANYATTSVNQTYLGNYAIRGYDSVLSGSVIPTVNAANYAIGSGALAFDVCGQYVAVNTGLASDANGLSFAFWMRGNSLCGNYTIIDFAGGVGGTDRITWGLQNNTVFTQVVSNDKVGAITYLGGGTIIGVGFAALSTPNIILNGNGMIFSSGTNAYYSKNINGSWTSPVSIYSHIYMGYLSVTADGKRMVWCADTVANTYYTTWNGTSWGPLLSSNAGGGRINHSLMSADGNRFFMNTSAGLRFGTWDGSNYGGWTVVTGTSGDRQTFCITPDANKIFYLNAASYCYYATWNPTLNNYNSGILVDSITFSNNGMTCSPDGYILYVSMKLYVWNNNTQKYQFVLTTATTTTLTLSMQMTDGFYSSSPGVFYILWGYSYNVYRYTFSISNFYYSSCNFITNATNLNDNVWRHFVWTIDPTNKTYKQYINGQLILTDMSSGYVFPQIGYNHTNNRIGGAADVSMSYFLGGIDDFRVYKKVLSQADIFPLILQSPPVIHYTMETKSFSGSNLGNYATGTYVYDASLNGNAVLTGTPTVNTIDYVVESGSLAFNVSGQYVSINSGLTSDANGLSFAFWMRGNNSVGNYTVFDFAGGAGGNNKITWGLQSNTIYTQVTSDVNVGALTFTTPVDVIDISGWSSTGICMTGDGKRFIIANYYVGTIKTYYYSGSSWVLINTLEGQANLTGVCCTADGNRIAFTRRSYGVYFATWNSGTSSYIVNGTAISTILSTGVPSMTPDGRVLLFAAGSFATPTGPVYYSFWNGSSYTTPSPVSGCSTSSYGGTSITPDGSRIAYTIYGTKTVYSGYWNGSQYVQDTNPIGTTTTANPTQVCFSPDGNILLVMNVSATTNFFYSIYNGTSYGALTYSGVNFSVGNPTGTIILYDNTIYSCSWSETGINLYVQKSTFTASKSYLKTNFSAIQSYYPTLNDNIWRHFAWTIDPANKTYKHYINGNLIATDVSTGYVFPQIGFNRTKNLLGVSNDLSMSYFVGGLDDFRVYKKVLSAAEVSTLSALTSNRLLNYYTQSVDYYNPIAYYYTFNTNSISGNSLLNNTTNTYDASLNGNSVATGRPTINTTNYIVGNGSLAFDVSGQFVTLRTSLTPDSNGLSFAFWMRGNNSIGNNTVFDFATGSGGKHKITWGLQSNTIYTQVTSTTSIGTLTFTAPANVIGLDGSGVHGMCMTNDGIRFLIVDYNNAAIKTYIYSGSAWVLVHRLSVSGTVTGVCCTNDGNRIVYTVRNAYVYYATWSSTTSSYTIQIPTITNTTNTASPSMTPDGRVLIFANQTNNLVYYSFWTGSGYTAPVAVTNCTNAAKFGTDITQDGSRIAYVDTTGTVRTGYWNGSGYTENAVAITNAASPPVNPFQVRFSPDGNILFVLYGVIANNLFYSIFNGTTYGTLVDSGKIFTNIALQAASGIVVGYDNSVYASGYTVSANQNIQKLTFTASASYLKSNFPAITSAYPNLNDNVWRHFAWTIDPTNKTYKHYINGTLLVTDVNTAYVFPLVGTGKGSNFLGVANDLSMSYFVGGLDDFRVYNKVLSAAEVLNLTTSLLSTQLSNYYSTPIALYYSFNADRLGGSNLKNDITSVYDASLNGNTVAVGRPTINTTNYALGNGSLAFDVCGQYVAINSGLSSDANGLTFAFWMRGNNSIGNYTVFDFAGGAGGNNKISYGLQNNTVYTQVVSDVNVGTVSFSSPTTLAFLPTIPTGSTLNDRYVNIAVSADETTMVFASTWDLSLSYVKYSNGSWGTPVRITGLAYSGSITTGFIAITGDASRIVYTSDNSLNFATWTNLNGGAYTGITRLPSFPTVPPTNCYVSAIDMTTDGSILVASIVDFTESSTNGAIYFSRWTGSNYSSFTAITTPDSDSLKTYFGVCITADGNRIFYNQGVPVTNQNVYYANWNGTTYVSVATPIATFTSGTNYLRNIRCTADGSIMFLSNYNGENALQYFVWNGTDYGTVQNVPTSVIPYDTANDRHSYQCSITPTNSLYINISYTRLLVSNTYKITFSASKLYTKTNFPAITSAYPTLNDNVWRHFAWTIDPANKTYKHYINGALIATDVSTGYVFPQIGYNRTKNLLGVSNDLSMSYFVGGLDDFCVYKRVLTAAEIIVIRALSNNQPPIYPPINYTLPINYYYSFNAGSASGFNLKNDGSSVYDASLNGSSAAVGTPTINTTNYAVGTGSLAFDVSGQYVSINTGFMNDSNGISFAFWMRGNNLCGNNTVFDFAGGAGGNNKITYSLQSNTVYTQVTNTTSIGTVTVGTPVDAFDISFSGVCGIAMSYDTKILLVTDYNNGNIKRYINTNSKLTLQSTLTGQGVVNGICCTADGNRIVFTRNTGVYFATWNAGTSTYTNTTLIYSSASTLSPNMTPDGGIIVFLDMPANSGKPYYTFWNGSSYNTPSISVYGLNNELYSSVDIKPDGSRLVYSTRWASSQIFGAYWDGSKFVHIGVIGGGSVVQRTKYSQDGNIFFYTQNGNYLTGASNSVTFSNITSGTYPGGIIITYDNNIYAADYTAAATYKFIQKASITFSNLYTNANFPAILSTYPNLNDGVWRHFAWTIDCSANLVTYKHYINGALIVTDASTGYVFPQVGFNRTQNLLGVANDLSMSYFLGGLDDFRIYNRVLTATDVTNLSLMAPAVYYTFDAGSTGGTRVGNYASGALVYDATLKGNSVAVGTPTINTVDNRVGSGSLAFTVSGQFMSINSGLTAGSTGLSFAFWMRGNNSMGNATVFDFAGGPGDNNTIKYGLQSNTIFTQVVSDTSLGTVSFGSPTTLAFLPAIPAGSNSYVNIAVSADETTMIYADTSDLSLSFVKYADGAWGTPVRITGLTYNSYRYNGFIAMNGDASRIVYTSINSLYFSTWTNLNGGAYTGITQLPSFPTVPPANCYVSAIDMTTDGSILVVSIVDFTGTTTDGAIYFARWTGSTYSSFTAITTPDATNLESYQSICITADGNRIFYNQGYGVTNQNVYYANWNGTTYTSVATPIATFTSGNNYLRSIRCTADGGIVFLSNNGGANALQYFVWNGTDYGTVQNVPTSAIPYDTGNTPYSFQFAVSSNNSLYINACSNEASSISYKTSFSCSNLYSLTNMPAIQSAYATLNDNSWRHFAWTIDPVNKTYKHYVNGSLDVVDVSTGYVFPHASYNRTSNFLGVANDLSMSYFVGGLDDFRIYKRVITGDEVTALYNLYTPSPNLTTAAVANTYSNDTVKNNYIFGVNRQVYSSDGLEWYDSNTSVVIDSPPNHFAWNGTIWVAAGKGGNTLSYSSDNQSWTGLGRSTFTTEALGIAWNSLFVAVGTGGNTIAYSQDGLSWTGLGTGIFSTSGTSVAWNGTRWVATGSGGNTLAYSSDGKTWIGSGAAAAGVLTGGLSVGTNYVNGQMNSSVISNLSNLDVIGDSYSGGYANASVGVKTFPTG